MLCGRSMREYDERRSDKGFLLQDDPARGGRRAAVLHFPVRLREKRRTGLPMALDTLRAAVRHLAAASLDHTGRRLSGRRDRAVRAELHSGWDYRRLCSGLAADRGGVVCAADGVEIDRQE